MVEVAHDQAARQVRFLVGRDEVVEHPVELGPIGHLRHRILGHLGVQRLALFFERRFRRNVVQQHGRAVDRAVVAADRNRVQIDRHVPALPAHDAHAAEPLHAGRNRVGHRAIFVRDPLLAAVAHVHQARQQRPAAGRARC